MNLDDWHNRENKTLQVVLDEQWIFLINAKAEKQHFTLPMQAVSQWKHVCGTTHLTLHENQVEVDGVAFCVLRKY